MASLSIWQAGAFRLDLRVPRIMGIVNVTPDSFSDGGIMPILSVRSATPKAGA